MITVWHRPRPGGGAASLSLVLAAITVMLYLPALDGEFVYDSWSQILVDDYVHDLYHLPDVLLFRVVAQDVLDGVRPVHLLSLMIDSALWGKNPVGYHLTNVLLHAANTMLLFWFLLHLIRIQIPGTCPESKSSDGIVPLARGDYRGSLSGADVPVPFFPTPYLPQPLLGKEGRTQRHALAGAFIGALFFAIHPIHGETVCEVSYREDLLAMFFMLSGLQFAIFFTPVLTRKNIVFGAACVFSFLLSVASKEVGIAGPPLLFLYWFLFRRAENRSAWVWLIGGASMLVGTFLVARFTLAPEQAWVGHQRPDYLGGSFLEMLRIQPRLWFLSARLMVWPQDLCADYGPYAIRHTSMGLALASLAATGFFQGILICRKEKAILLAAAIYWSGLLPVSNLAPIYRPLADHFLYLPMVGLALLIAMLVAQPVWWKSLRRSRIMMTVCLIMCGILACLTFERERAWHDRVSLWTDTMETNPFSYTAANNLAFALFDRGDISEAVLSWRKAIELSKGKQADSLAGLAIGLEALGFSREADQAFEKAAELDPRYQDPSLLVKSLIWDQQQAQKLRVIARRVAR